MIEHCVSRSTDCCKARSGIRRGDHSNADEAKRSRCRHRRPGCTPPAAWRSTRPAAPGLTTAAGRNRSCTVAQIGNPADRFVAKPIARRAAGGRGKRSPAGLARDDCLPSIAIVPGHRTGRSLVGGRASALPGAGRPIRMIASSPKGLPVWRRREHECDRASGKNAALPSDRRGRSGALAAGCSFVAKSDLTVARDAEAEMPAGTREGSSLCRRPR
jgi:hypothetical protein